MDRRDQDTPPDGDMPPAGTRCPHADNCSLFPLFNLQSTNDIWCTFYCFSKYADCARYQLAIEGKPMPHTLLPNGQWLKTPA